MDSNFRITIPPTFVDEQYQIPVTRVYVSQEAPEIRDKYLCWTL